MSRHDDLRSAAPGLVVEGHEAIPVCRPETTQQVAQILALASERQWSVRPRGAGWWTSAWGLPGPAPSGSIVVDMKALDAVLQYEPADLTLTIGAGATLNQVDALTSPNQQWLPLDPAGGGTGTLGAVVATGSSGPLQAGFGGPRDLVLGATVVTGDGRVLELGGHVVKNVAGFDLLKLMIGGWATFGIVTEVSVRVYPRPDVDRTLTYEFDSAAQAAATVRALATAPVVPSALEVRVGRPVGVLARVCGSEASVQAELGLLCGAVSAAVEGAAAHPRDPRTTESSTEWPGPGQGAELSEDPSYLGPTMRPEFLGAFLPAAFSEIAGGLDALAGAGWEVVVQAYDGRVHLRAPEGGAADEPVPPPMDGLEIVPLVLPNQARESLSMTSGAGPCGRPAVRGLVERLKRSFDPAGVLS